MEGQGLHILESVEIPQLQSKRGGNCSLSSFIRVNEQLCDLQRNPTRCQQSRMKGLETESQSFSISQEQPYRGRRSSYAVLRGVRSWRYAVSGAPLVKEASVLVERGADAMLLEIRRDSLTLRRVHNLRKTSMS